jgi:APA family basic amino acid/polyamine antiporter
MASDVLMTRKTVFFKKAAELNKASVPAWSIWAQCIWASV